MRCEVIQGGIQHTETLPPVPAGMQKGSVFASPDALPTVQWFPVPDWLAGTWLKDGDVETFSEDLRSGRSSTRQVWINNRVKLSFGHQLDALRTIWHAEVLPFRADGERGNMQDRRYVMDMSCMKSTPQEVILRFRSAIAVIDPGSQRVIDNEQQEEIVSFAQTSPGIITTRSSTKSFTGSGQPLFQAETHTQRRKLAEFTPVDNLQGIDLKASLSQFLSNSNMSNRIPVSDNSNDSRSTY
ncbi:MAG: hypothetical protein K2Z81_12055 [Cyanobacteria bacterium]|nr:hypothetical protein [Cyanobacteriota bacterium]